MVSVRKKLLLFSLLLSWHLFTVPKVVANDNVPWRLGLFATMGAFVAINPLNADLQFLELGEGHDAEFTRIASRWYFDGQKAFKNGSVIQTGVQVGFSKMNSNLSPDKPSDDDEEATAEYLRLTQSLMTFDVLPIFRWSFKSLPLIDYIESGVGLSYVSEIQIAERELGGHLQFNSYFGVGRQIGPKDRWELSFNTHHFSNNDIYQLNKGINFFSVKLGLRY